MRDVALFDWDKTVRFGGYVILDFIKLLAEDGIVDENIENEISKVLKEHSKGSITYTEFANKCVQIYRKVY